MNKLVKFSVFLVVFCISFCLMFSSTAVYAFVNPIKIYKGVKRTRQIRTSIEALELAAKAAKKGEKIVLAGSATKLLDDFPRLATKNSHLAGSFHEVTNVPFVERVVTYNGKQVIGVFPDFDSVTWVELPKSMYKAPLDEHFKYCSKDLAKQIENNPDLAKSFNERQLAQIKAGSPKIDGFTWHHNEEEGIIELVDAEIHAKTGHHGGSSIWGPNDGKGLEYE